MTDCAIRRCRCWSQLRNCAEAKYRTERGQITQLQVGDAIVSGYGPVIRDLASTIICDAILGVMYLICATILVVDAASFSTESIPI